MTPEQVALVESHQRFATVFAIRWHRGVDSRIIERDDLEGVALLALCAAARSYTPSKQVTFHAYVNMRMHGDIVDYIRRQYHAKGSVRKNTGEIVAVQAYTHVDNPALAAASREARPDRYDRAWDLVGCLRRLPVQDARLLVMRATGARNVEIGRFLGGKCDSRVSQRIAAAAKQMRRLLVGAP
jgi:RNA polymerase sigma factor (sigma-70 family)